MEDHFFPTLKNKITLRSESFGGYLFDPRAYGSIDLGTIEFLVAISCNGRHSVADIISFVASHENWETSKANETTWHALRRFQSLSLVEWLMEPLREPRFTKVPALIQA